MINYITSQTFKYYSRLCQLPEDRLLKEIFELDKSLRYCEKVYERSGKNLFWSIKNSGEVLNKLKSRGFRATSLSTYDFSTLYTTLPHNLIKEKLINLIEWTFKREGSPYIACNERQAFFTSEDTKRYKLWSCQNVCEALKIKWQSFNYFKVIVICW